MQLLYQSMVRHQAAQAAPLAGAEWWVQVGCHCEVYVPPVCLTLSACAGV